MGVVTHILTFDPNFQRDIQDMIQYDTAILRRHFASRFHRRPQAGLDKHCRLDSKDSMVRKSQGLWLVNLPPNVPPPPEIRV